MTKTYEQLTKQIETLSREAEKIKRKEREGVIARMKDAIVIYDITASDLGLTGPGRKAGAKAIGKGKAGKSKSARAVRFRDEAGNVWVGRGPRPQWLRTALAAGKQLEDFAV
jgi:DNA-binding protein H-NS